MKPVNLGVIGRGKWGRNILASIPKNARISWVCDSKGIHVYPQGDEVDVQRLPGDWRQALDRADIDAVVVATPASLHEEMACEVLRRGLPLFLEKPAALSLSGIDRIDRAWEDAGRPALLVDHTYLFHPSYERLYALARGVVIGGIAVFGGPMPERSDCPLLWDWGPHAVAALVDLGIERASRSWNVGLWPANHRFISVGLRGGETLEWNGGEVIRHSVSGSHAEIPLHLSVMLRDGESPEPLARALALFVNAVQRDPTARADRRLGPHLAVEVTREIVRRGERQAQAGWPTSRWAAR